jgi:heme A synthase
VLTITEALVGAALVKLDLVAGNRSPSRAGWMALHLVNTFFLVAAVTCTAYWSSRDERPRLRGQGLLGALAILGVAGTLTVGVTGALTALGDTLFTPTSLRQGLADDFSPAAHFLQRLRVIHPVAAVLVTVFLLYARAAFVARRPTPDVRRFSTALAMLVASQIALGFLNVALLAPVWMQLVHLLVADLVWIVFLLLSAAALEEPAALIAGEAGLADRGAVLRESA